MKRFGPKTPTDWIALAFLQGSIHTVGLYELFIILPYIDGERSSTFWLHVTLGVFLYLNIAYSFYKLLMVDTTTSRDGIIMPSILKPGWRFCSACEANSPPRAYHCWCCDTCILRRDHHCVFSGCCIGFANQRYFMTFMFQMTIATLYCCYLNMDYAFEVLEGFSLKTLFTMIMPLFSWVLGLAGAYPFVIAFFSALCLFGSLLSGGLFCYHMLNLVYGQTTYERGQEIHKWDCGWRQNLEDVLGERWYLVWLGSWFPSKVNGDGINFVTCKEAKQYENVKDL